MMMKKTQKNSPLSKSALIARMCNFGPCFLQNFETLCQHVVEKWRRKDAQKNNYDKSMEFRKSSDRSIKSLLPTPYLFLGGFIFFWWFLAFKFENTPIPSPPSFSQPLFISNATLLNALSPLNRQTLKNALAGDFSLIRDLIEGWDEDASYLLKKGLKNVSRIDAEKLLQARILATLICDSTEEELHTLNSKICLKTLRDDRKVTHAIEDHFCRFLPQTYASASFLLSIVDPKKIIAIPRGMRRLSQIYAPENMQQISCDVENLNSEALYLQRPDVAFVAPYSNPSTLSLWRSQHIPLFSIGRTNSVSVEGIEQALLKVGHATRHLVQAQLLAIFMEAAFLAIDNRLEVLTSTDDKSLKDLKLLYLRYHQQFFIPSQQSLEGKILHRLLSHCPRIKSLTSKSFGAWQKSFEKEQITTFDPDIFIVSLSHAKHEQEINHHVLSSILNSRKRVCFVDEDLQTSPTQYITLAYYDLYEALASL